MKEDQTEDKQENSQPGSGPIRTPNQGQTKIIANETQNKKDVLTLLRKVGLHFKGVNFTNFFLCLFTFALVIVSCLQWKTINRQADIMSQQTTLMRQQLVGSQAAVLYFSAGLNALGELQFGLSNGGHVTATDIYLRLEVAREKVSTGTRVGKPIIFEPNVPPIKGGDGFGHTWLLPWGQQLSQLRQTREWPKNWPGSEIVTVRAKFSYQNGFGDLVQEEVCKKWLPQYTIKTKTGFSSSGGSLQYDCKDNIHTAIESVLELKRKAEQEK
jgi:hypothetical protein